MFAIIISLQHENKANGLKLVQPPSVFTYLLFFIWLNSYDFRGRHGRELSSESSDDDYDEVDLRSFWLVH